MEKIPDIYAQKYTPDAMKAGFEQLGDPSAIPEWFLPVMSVVILLSLMTLAVITLRRP